MEAPITGCPSSELITVPEIFTWAKAAPTYIKRLANSKVNLFPINFLSLVIINATLLGCRIDYPVQKDG